MDLNIPPVGYYARQKLGRLLNENFEDIEEELEALDDRVTDLENAE